MALSGALGLTLATVVMWVVATTADVSLKMAIAATIASAVIGLDIGVVVGALKKKN
jgi:ABC-type dipeptide/oligopeptide/nickel transport system permease subunit